MRPDAASARRYVLLSVFGLIAISAYRGKLTGTNAATGEGFTKRLWGVGWLAIMLGIAADVAPTVAGPFAVLILLGSLTNGGDQAIQNLLGKLGSTSTPATSSGGANKNVPGGHI